MSQSPSLLVLCGPTASGKSALAVELALRIGGEIVSCDSLAVYRELDVGTAKPSPDERARVAHHLIDVVAPDEPFTAARYVALADHAISDIAARGRHAIVVGGTGLYLRALIFGIFDSPAPDPEVRARIKADARSLGWPALHERLRAVDPEAAARIAPNDPVRIERALEVFEQTGRPISKLQQEQTRSPRYAARTVVLSPPSDALERNIAERTKRMLAGGLVEETRRVVLRYGRNLKPLGALGYKESLAHLEGRLAESALFETIRVATRRYAKRQRTWFAREAGTRIDAPMVERVLEAWNLDGAVR